MTQEEYVAWLIVTVFEMDWKGESELIQHTSDAQRIVVC